jgi:hypothetical protein
VKDGGGEDYREDWGYGGSLRGSYLEVIRVGGEPVELEFDVSVGEEGLQPADKLQWEAHGSEDRY